MASGQPTAVNLLRRRLLGLAGTWLLLRSGAALADDDIVEVIRSGEAYEILVSLVVQAPHLDVWDVITDFDRMATIVSNLRTSRIVSRSGQRVLVEQAGAEAQGPLRFEFHSLREVDLSPPSDMHSRLIRGSMRRLDGWTGLQAAESGTRIVSYGILDAGHWVPPLVAPLFMQRATRKQYAEMCDEMLRRQAARRSPTGS